MPKNPESHGNQVSGLYPHPAGAVGTPATAGNGMMKQNKASVLSEALS